MGCSGSQLKLFITKYRYYPKNSINPMNTIKAILAGLSVLSLFLFSGCSSDTVRDGIHNSPTARFLRGETDNGGYYNEMKAQNEAYNDQQTFDMNREEYRAYNLDTGKFEYIDPEYEFRTWNEAEQRWEFKPMRKEAQQLAEKKAKEEAEGN